MSDRRLTLIARDSGKPHMDWNHAGLRHAGVAFTESTAALERALAAGIDMGFDIGRIIVDRTGAGDEFLDLLTALPSEYTGDALLIRDDGSGVLSAMGRGGDRTLHALNVHDVRFYLEAHDLVMSRVALEMTA